VKSEKLKSKKLREADFKRGSDAVFLIFTF